MARWRVVVMIVAQIGGRPKSGLTTLDVIMLRRPLVEGMLPRYFTAHAGVWESQVNFAPMCSSSSALLSSNSLIGRPRIASCLLPGRLVSLV